MHMERYLFGHTKAKALKISALRIHISQNDFSFAENESEKSRVRGRERVYFIARARILKHALLDIALTKCASATVDY